MDLKKPSVWDLNRRSRLTKYHGLSISGKILIVKLPGKFGSLRPSLTILIQSLMFTAQKSGAWGPTHSGKFDVEFELER